MRRAGAGVEREPDGSSRPTISSGPRPCRSTDRSAPRAPLGSIASSSPVPRRRSATPALGGTSGANGRSSRSSPGRSRIDSSIVATCWPCCARESSPASARSSELGVHYAEPYPGERSEGIYPAASTSLVGGTRSSRRTASSRLCRRPALERYLGKPVSGTPTAMPSHGRSAVSGLGRACEQHADAAQ
jgi:hypothetical protein